MGAERVEDLKADEKNEFDSGLEVTEYLKNIGYKVSKSKVYRDISDGLLNKNSSGVFTLKAVELYAKKFCERIDGKSDVKRRKIATVTDLKALQAQMLEIKKQLLERELEIKSGEYIQRDEVVAMLASRAYRFKNDLLSMVFKEVPELCIILNGDDKNIGQAIVYLKSKIEDILREYAK